MRGPHSTSPHPILTAIISPARDIFHMSSYYLQRALTSEIPKLFADLRASGLSISLDTNDDPAQAWHRDVLNALCYVDVLLPNEREACLLALETDMGKAIKILRSLVPLLIIKRGSLGATAYTPTGCCSAAARQVKVIDAVGAGDSFNAGFLQGWVRGWPIEDSLAFGNLSGAWSTTESGGTTAFHGKERLAAFHKAWADSLPGQS
jgi:sugar/nucleoside kinase (ribokinase family)